MAVSVRCNSCPVASWKLRGEPNLSMSARELYDLSTNPEELASLNVLTGPMAANFNGVKGTLLAHLKGWYQCVKNKIGEDGLVNCENQEVP